MQPIIMTMIYFWDKKTKKKDCNVVEPDIITIKKDIDLMSLAQRMHFLQYMFKMIAILFASVINHYHIKGLNLFWDSL